MGTIVNLFKVMLIVQLFYALSITLLTYSFAGMPNALQQINPFSSITDTINIDSIGNKVQGSMTRTLGIPLIDFGALILYSGNIFIDLLLNFYLAIPQMITILLNGLMTLFSLDTFILAYVEVFAAVLITAMYIISLVQLITNIRSRGSIV